MDEQRIHDLERRIEVLEAAVTTVLEVPFRRAPAHDTMGLEDKLLLLATLGLSITLTNQHGGEWLCIIDGAVGKVGDDPMAALNSAIERHGEVRRPVWEESIIDEDKPLEEVEVTDLLGEAPDPPEAE